VQPLPPSQICRLLKELPSILNWALVGWKRVRETKKLVQPKSGEDLVQELLDTTSLVHRFVSAQGQVGPEEKVAKESFFDEWSRWCSNHYLGKYSGNPLSFGRTLETAFPQIQDGKITVRGERVNAYIGIGLKPEPPRPGCPGSVLVATPIQDTFKI
jgi:putative DNA primase/helicase